MSDYTDQQIQDLHADIKNAEQSLQAGDADSAVADVRDYYQLQASFRGYAGDALQVVNDTGVFGLVANQEVIDALGQDGWAKEISTIAVRLAAADDAIIDDPAHTIPTENQIADYHSEVYGALGIDSSHWGGATGASLGLDWAGGTLKPIETDQDLTKNVFYANADEDQTRNALGNLLIAGAEALVNNKATFGLSLYPGGAAFNGFVSMFKFQHAFDEKYGHIDPEFGMNEGSTASQTYADVSSIQTTLAAADDGVTYLGAVEHTSNAGKDRYDVGGIGSVVEAQDAVLRFEPDAAAKVTGDGDTISVAAAAPSAMGSSDDRTVVVTTGDHEVILAGGSKTLVDTETGQDDTIFLPGAAGQPDAGTQIVLSPGTKTIVGAGPKDALDLLAPRFTVDAPPPPDPNGAPPPPRAGPVPDGTLSTAEGLVPLQYVTGPFGQHFWAETSDDYYVTFATYRKDLIIDFTSGRGDDRWNSSIDVVDFHNGDLGINLPTDTALYDESTVSPDGTAAKATFIDDDPTIAWGGQRGFDYDNTGIPDGFTQANYSDLMKMMTDAQEAANKGFDPSDPSNPNPDPSPSSDPNSPPQSANQTSTGNGQGDTLFAPQNGATLVAGKGSDTFSLALAGSDTIQFAKGDGHTTVTDRGDGYTRSDTLDLPDLLASDLTLTRSGDALTITTAAGDEIDLPYQFYATDPYAAYGIGTEQGVASIRFADGTSWNRDQIAAAAPYRAGDAGANITAPDECDATLIAGAGTDVFQGGYGNDTFVYAARDGNLTVYNQNYSSEYAADVLSLKDLNSGDLTVARQNSDLMITIASTGRTIDVSGQFDYGGLDGVAQISFADGTSWGRSDIAQHAKSAA